MSVTFFDDPKVIRTVKTGYKSLKDKKIIQETRESLLNLLDEQNLDYTEMHDRIVINGTSADIISKVQTAISTLAKEVPSIKLMFSIVNTKKKLIIKEKRK